MPGTFGSTPVTFVTPTPFTVILDKYISTSNDILVAICIVTVEAAGDELGHGVGSGVTLGVTLGVLVGVGVNDGVGDGSWLHVEPCVNVIYGLVKNVNLLRELIDSDMSYDFEVGASKKFATDHYNFYKLTLNKEPRKKSKVSSKVNIIQYFVNQPFLEIKGEGDSDYEIKFFDEHDVCHYHNTLKANHWIKLNREYFTKWNTKIWEDGTLIYNETLNYKDKRVFINFI